MNGFERHKIDHGSASMIKDAINNPAKFIASRCLGVHWNMNSHVDRGTAIEHGIEQVILGRLSFKDGLTEAYRVYDELTGMRLTDRALETNRDRINPSMKLGIEALKEYGKPLAAEIDPLRPDRPAQHKVVINCKTEEWVLPIWGYLDFVFPETKTIIDLKTTSRIPKTMSRDHQRQRAIYAAAKPGWAVKFLYVSSASTVTLEDGDIPEIMGDIKKALVRFERFLALGGAEFLASIIPMDPQDPEFDTPDKREVLRTIFGF